ncbi:MAG: nicotinate-nucleotide--dimethylbenzimidazole phosphoribosyltransferase [Porticoccaceae bacterium]|nr:MAG: nicotinate-nucleotide--dimethylbenzimidazole phosphoribosyltransferase [Porticoccaceae bacterium]
MDWWLKPVTDISRQSREAALERQQQLTKPAGSLGTLEILAVQFAGWQGKEKPELNRIDIRVFAGDHGVVAEGVSAYPQAVTVEMIKNFARGGAAISVLARQCGATFNVVNMGTVVASPNHELVVNLQLAEGTNNFCQLPAMDEDTVRCALAAGAEEIPSSSDLFVGGEMGIGNTTSAAALTSAFLGLSPDVSVGRGTGVDDDGVVKKREVVSRALRLHEEHCETPLGILRCLGGLEIAALAGAYISAAQQGIPSVVDGYICTAAAVAACRLNPGVRDWLLFSHCSAEPGHRYLLDELSAEPLLDLGLRLGEGSGAALVIPLLQSACRLHNEMATFAEAGVSEQEAP